MRLLTILGLLGALALVGCGDSGGETMPRPQPNKTKPATSAGKGPAPKASATVSPTAGMPPLPMREFQESDFTETEKSRDPFRVFDKLLVRQAKGQVNLQR